MPVEVIPDFRPPIRLLFVLASGSFAPGSFRDRCEQFASFDDSSSWNDLWRFTLSDEATLIVALDCGKTGPSKPDGEPELTPQAVSCAILSLCWWETFLDSQHANFQSWKSEKEEFDRQYCHWLAETIEVLGTPVLQGRDTDSDGHRYAIWRGETGLLILQQSAYDPQFGLDVNFWIQPWSGADPNPTSPFINWLMSRPSKRPDSY